jgi:hypothetical protein
MAGGAELLLLFVLGCALFRLARPLRDRIEAWYLRWLPPAHERPRVMNLRRRRDGSFGAEDRNGDD